MAEEKVVACQHALRDPEIADVEALSEAVGTGRRTLERLCGRYFGFPPKLLLRRQRFLRSLARFTLEPNTIGVRRSTGNISTRRISCATFAASWA